MSKKTKGRDDNASNKRALLRIIDEYIAETGDNFPVLYEVAQWARRTKRMAAPRVDADLILAKRLSHASQQDFFNDENNQPVRRRHAYREIRGEIQKTFWFKMEDATPEKMKLSAQGRRRGVLGDILQLDRDLRYFNNHHNPGDAIQMTWDFDKDVQEKNLPTQYPEEPPTED